MRRESGELADRLREVAVTRVLALCDGVETHAQFTRETGIQWATVESWRGAGQKARRSLPGALALAILAEWSGVSVDWLLGFDVPRERGETGGGTAGRLYYLVVSHEGRALDVCGTREFAKVRARQYNEEAQPSFRYRVITVRTVREV